MIARKAFAAPDKGGPVSPPPNIPSPSTPSYLPPEYAFSGNDLIVAKRVLSWLPLIVGASSTYKVPVPLIAAVIHHESGGCACATNKSDPSYGLMQICCKKCTPCPSSDGKYCHPCCGCQGYSGDIGECKGYDFKGPEPCGTFEYYEASGLYDPITNISLGTRFLSRLIERYGGELHKVVGAYNLGRYDPNINSGYIDRVMSLYYNYSTLFRMK